MVAYTRRETEMKLPRKKEGGGVMSKELKLPCYKALLSKLIVGLFLLHKTVYIVIYGSNVDHCESPSFQWASKAVL